MKKLFGALAAIFILAQPVQAQVLSDSVTVRIFEIGDLELVISPTDYRGAVGDTVTFEAHVIDGPTGDTISAIVTWEAADPSAVQIDPDTGFARFLTRGSHVVRVRAERIVALNIYRQIGSSVFPVDTLHLTVGQTAQLCAYLVGTTGNIIAGSEGCPLPASSPGWAPALPYQDLMRMGSQVGP